MMTMSVRVSGDVRPSKALHLGLWVVQGLLGVLFLAVGAMKATQPIAVLVDTFGWPAVPTTLTSRVCSPGATSRAKTTRRGLLSVVAW